LSACPASAARPPAAQYRITVLPVSKRASCCGASGPQRIRAIRADVHGTGGLAALLDLGRLSHVDKHGVALGK